MKKLIIILTAVATFFTVTNVIATVNIFSQTTAMATNMEVTSTISDPSVIQGCYTATRNISHVKADACNGQTIEYPRQETFVFMDEIYPNKPENLYTNDTGEGFIFMDEYFEPMPENNEDILPPNVQEHAMN